MCRTGDVHGVSVSPKLQTNGWSSWDRDVQVIAGHNLAEALYSISNASDASGLVQSVENFIPRASKAIINHIVDALYPANKYSSETQRAGQIATGSTFSCSTRYLSLAFKNATYN